MTSRPDVVVPPSLPTQQRQVIAAIYQRLRMLEAQVDALPTGRSTTVVSRGGVAIPNPPASTVLTVTTLTTSTTLTSVGVYLCDETGGSFTATLPSAAGKSGQVWYFMKIGGTANVVTIAAAGGETVQDEPDLAMNAPQMSITLFSDGANWRII